MKVGDLVIYTPDAFGVIGATGIIIEVINSIEVPRVCKVFWHDGTLDKEWTDDLEVISESR
jgi:hypothetical protein